MDFWRCGSFGRQSCSIYKEWIFKEELVMCAKKRRKLLWFGRFTIAWFLPVYIFRYLVEAWKKPLWNMNSQLEKRNVVQTSLPEKKASFCSIFAGKCVVNIFLYSHTNALSHSTHILIRIPSMLLPMLFTHGFNFIKFDILRCYKTAYFFICLSLRLLLRAFLC